MKLTTEFNCECSCTLYSPFVTWQSRILPSPVMNLLQSGVRNLWQQYCEEGTRNSTRNEYLLLFLMHNSAPLQPTIAVARVTKLTYCAIQRPLPLQPSYKRRPDIIFAVRSIVTSILARKFALSDLDHLPTILIPWKERDDVIVRCITPLPGVNVLE